MRRSQFTDNEILHLALRSQRPAFRWRRFCRTAGGCRFAPSIRWAPSFLAVSMRPAVMQMKELAAENLRAAGFGQQFVRNACAIPAEKASAARGCADKRLRPRDDKERKQKQANPERCGKNAVAL